MEGCVVRYKPNDDIEMAHRRPISYNRVPISSSPQIREGAVKKLDSAIEKLKGGRFIKRVQQKNANSNATKRASKVLSLGTRHVIQTMGSTRQSEQVDAAHRALVRQLEILKASLHTSECKTLKTQISTTIQSVKVLQKAVQKAGRSSSRNVTMMDDNDVDTDYGSDYDTAEATASSATRGGETDDEDDFMPQRMPLPTPASHDTGPLARCTWTSSRTLQPLFREGQPFRLRSYYPNNPDGHVFIEVKATDQMTRKSCIFTLGVGHHTSRPSALLQSPDSQDYVLSGLLKACADKHRSHRSPVLECLGLVEPFKTLERQKALEGEQGAPGQLPYFAPKGLPFFMGIRNLMGVAEGFLTVHQARLLTVIRDKLEFSQRINSWIIELPYSYASMICQDGASTNCHSFAWRFANDAENLLRELTTPPR
jgi:hypothetical protein